MISLAVEPAGADGVGPRERGLLVEWLWLIIAGAFVGLLGKLFAPGDKDNVPLLLTVLLGIVGVLLGRAIAAGLGVEDTRGGDWIKWFIEIAIAVVLVMITSVVLGKRKART